MGITHSGMMSSSVQQISQEESDGMFDLFDADGNGTVDMKELMAMIAEVKQTDSSKLNQAKIREAWDSDNDGKVSKEEFHERLVRAAAKMPELLERFKSVAATKKAPLLFKAVPFTNSISMNRKDLSERMKNDLEQVRDGLVQENALLKARCAKLQSDKPILEEETKQLADDFKEDIHRRAAMKMQLEGAVTSL